MLIIRFYKGCVILLLGLVLSTQVESQVVISEFMASNGATIQDEDGDSSDWIEIYNSTNVSVNLGGWFLSNDSNNLSQWKFPSRILPAKGLLMVWASGKDRKSSDGPMHTNFSLNANG